MKISITENTNKNYPATYNQVQFFQKLGGRVLCAPSQLTRKLDRKIMSEAIDAQKNGEQVEIDIYA